MFLNVLLLIFGLSLCPLLASITCGDREVYVKFVKKTTKWANEESWQVMTGFSLVYESPPLTDDQVITIETCITSSSFNYYYVKMMDSGDDSWSDGAWLEIYGINNNLAVKLMMTEKSVEEYVRLSLYAPINKNAEW